MKKDPRVTKYIDRAADFAKPILEELRARIHELVPGAAKRAANAAYGMTYFSGLTRGTT